MKITLSKQMFAKKLQVGDSVPFSDRGMYIGNGTIVKDAGDHYEVEVDNRVEENLRRTGILS
ncbi:hypothetical protein [Brevibacillus fulvus]|uniref:Uncharacterized protein n=1 Tax=Brevibacillus fulvus TaxID=1125967 RepID=A0A939BSX5_9BACL|nr:hypothetical protein [Brevibacillus fulvus]MBM7588934.1 hypothetical protein [Brevibacillus fulvus]